MAVTQQFARLSAEHIESCRASVEALDAVCSFTSLEKRDYLDLDWYPSALLAAADQVRVEPSLIAALKFACEGRPEVNPAYWEAPDSIWEHPVNCLSRAEVTTCSADLHRLPDTDFAKPPREPKGLEDAFLALLEFYAEAARRHLAVAMWWD